MREVKEVPQMVSVLKGSICNNIDRNPLRKCIPILMGDSCVAEQDWLGSLQPERRSRRSFFPFLEQYPFSAMLNFPDSPDSS
ncbi:hypothetical protein [Chlorobium phaeobacteroides]|uniref:hypothetical protein n=1 Tax=Chlorobium phaeobacteroides TaxID=1096 RepID=UPI0000535EBA|nr:hypothetical protein [Chlorobium phaeobacteroides]